jgi:Fe2+ transport system protein B
MWQALRRVGGPIYWCREYPDADAGDLVPIPAGCVMMEQAASRSRAQPRRRIRLHPFSGLLIILLDNLFFGLNVATLGIGTLLACSLAFSVTTIGVYLAQRFLDRDSRRASLAKALLSGVLAGVPTSITGTIFGTAVLTASGLPRVSVNSLLTSRNRSDGKAE